MKLTIENYKQYVPQEDQNLISGILCGLLELNTELENDNKSYKKLYIDYITEHTEYSPERTDPCPDYYGMYRLVFEKNPYETVGVEMTIDELDTVMCALINFIEFQIDCYTYI